VSDWDSGSHPRGRQAQIARMPQMAMSMSFSGHLTKAVMGTLTISKQLEGLVTLGMSRSHKALCLDPVTAGSGLFCGAGLLAKGAPRSTVATPKCARATHPYRYNTLENAEPRKPGQKHDAHATCGGYRSTTAHRGSGAAPHESDLPASSR